MKKIWKAAIYLRLSKEDGQVMESSSVRNQREIIKHFVSKDKNIEIVSERIDDDVSGVSFDRPSFNAMIEDVRDGIIDCVIVKDLSRFGRDHLEAGEYLDNIFPSLSIRFIAVSDGVDTLNSNNESDKIMIPFRNLMNSNYSRDISIKSRNALQMKRKQGHFVGAFAAYGYMKSEENKNILITDERVCENVREIFKLRITGLSSERIAEHLNTTGVLSPGAYKKSLGMNYVVNFEGVGKGRWHANTVSRILQNPIYTGTLVQGKMGKVNYKAKDVTKRDVADWIVLHNNHEAIIEQELFDTVQKTLTLDTRVAPNKDELYLFSGLLFCAECGRPLKRKTVPYNDKKYLYYSCKSCKSKSIKEEKLDDCILTSIKSCITQRIAVLEFLEMVDTAKLCKLRVKKLSEQLSFCEQELDKICKYKRSLYESYVEKVISKSDYEHFYKDFSNDEDVTTKKIAQIKVEIEDITTQKDGSSTWLESFKIHKNIEKLNRAIVVSLIDKIFIEDNKTINIVFRFQSEYDKLVSALSQLEQPMMEVG